MVAVQERPQQTSLVRLSKKQLTAVLTGQKYHHAALPYVLQATVPASRREHYANMVSLYAALRHQAGQLVAIARLETMIGSVADLRFATGFLNSFSSSVAFQPTSSDGQ